MNETTKADAAMIAQQIGDIRRDKSRERLVAAIVDEEFVVRVHRRLNFVSWFVLEPEEICRAAAEEAIIAWEATKET